MIKQVLEKNEDLREFLFIRGFLATTRKDIDLDNYPFYGNWELFKFQNICFYKHKQTGFHFYEKDNKACFLFGHAYNPFTMEIDESKILQRIYPYIEKDVIYDYVDELTGVFVFGTIINGEISFLVDPSGMQSACYCVDEEDFYISSHPQLIADICQFEMSDFAKELVAYKWYPRVMGPYLPADMTPFEKVKRIVPNIAYSYKANEKLVRHYRFYPLKNLEECKSQEEYDKVIKEAADILRKNMELVLKKWNNPYLSLTGGD